LTIILSWEQSCDSWRLPLGS